MENKKIIINYFDEVEKIIKEDLSTDSPWLDKMTEFTALFNKIVKPYLDGRSEEEINDFFDELEDVEEPLFKKRLLERYGKIVSCYFGTF